MKYAHEYLRYKTDYPDNQNTPRYDNHYYQHDAYASAAYTWLPRPWASVNVSYDARMSWLDADLKRFDGVRRFDQKAVVAVQASYAGLRLAASGLFQHYRDHTSTKIGAARPIHRVTPSVSLGYSRGGLELRLWYKEIFRVPTLEDLYYTQIGNRNLKPENTRQWNLGAGYTLNTVRWNLSAQADAYVNHIDGRIVCLPLKGTYTWTMLNYGKTRCRGLNATLSAQFMPGRAWYFSLLNSLTWQKDLDRTDHGVATWNRQICYSPEFSCALTGIAGWRTYSLTASFLHVSERMWSYADPRDKLKPYNNVDIKLSGTWRAFGASLEVFDLFDVQYEHVPRYPMPGRNFRFSITYTI